MPDNLQFDRVEPTGAKNATLSCASCGTPLNDNYYIVSGKVTCERCRIIAEDEWSRGSETDRFWKALGLGALATAGCAVVWYAVLIGTNAQWGILAVIVGLVIGRAVHKGSDGRGGWQYQALAMFLTYTAIVGSWVPIARDAAREQGGLLAELAFFYSIPIKDAFGSVMGLVIIGIALYEAWKLNRKTELRVSGPHQVSATSPRQ